MAKIFGISGGITQPSRTKALVESIVIKASHKFHSQGDVVDVAQIAHVLGSTISFDSFAPPLADAYEKLNQADLIVIATPIYKASYTGLLKHFFDLVDPKQIAGKVAILAATGGSDQHALVLEYQLRSLASFFGLYTVPTTIYVKDTDFTNYKLSSETIDKRIEVALTQAEFLLAQRQPVSLAA